MRLIFGLVSSVIVLAAYFLMTDRRSGDNAPVGVMQKYIAATYARDFKQAYHYISSQDQKVRDEESYVQEKGAYSGFALELAKQLAEAIEISVLAHEQTSNRVRIKLHVKLPAAEDLSPIVYGWDSDKLNGLTPSERQRILEEVRKLKHGRKLVMVEGEDTFELIKEGGNWRLFLDWASGVKVAFGFSAPPSSGIEAQFSEKRIIARFGEPFQTTFKVKNRSSREVVTNISHLVEPAAIREHLEMIQCGLLSPMTLAPGHEREMSSIYILTGDFPESVKDVTINYAFIPEK
jgi:hypothetical protein